MPPACKVFQWIRKAGDATLCRRPKLDDDNNSIISRSSINVENSNTTRCRRRPSYGLIRHETGERETWRNKVSGDISPTTSTKDSIEKKKHKSLPIPPRTSSKTAGNSNQKIGAGLSVDTRRFCMVDPFNMGGHRRSYTLDTTWNITAFINNNSSFDNEESPATILIAKKENLSDARFSIQHPVRLNSIKCSVAKGIKEVEVREARTFRWESRRIYNEKTCSQLYELYENRCLVEKLEKLRDKPLPPIPNDNNNNNNDNIRFSTTIEDSNFIMDPELLSILDTISLVSDHMESSDDDDSIISTPTETSYESFSDLLITDNINLESVSSASSIHSIETLPVEVEMCLSCKRSSTDSVQFCKTCELKRFEEQFESWSTGNDDIDCFILESQLNSSNLFDCLEWIPFDGLRDIELFGFEDTFQAVWVDGPRKRWDAKNNKYVRHGECLVVLKCFEIPQDSSDFFDQLSEYLHCDDNSGMHIVHCYGITQDLESGKYMLVFQYAKDGNLFNYLKQYFADITWERRLEILYALAKGLDIIHEKNLVHGNLHNGNVLLDDSLTLISDLGTSCYSTTSNNDKGVYGVLPFVASELLKGKPYTMASDIYSFGIIMWELITGKSPFADRAHDEKLALEICKQGLRPEIPTDIPECYVKLLEQCWNPDPFERPCANVLCETICGWIKEISQSTSSYTSSTSSTPSISSEISIQFQQSEEKRLENVNTKDSQLDVHPEAIYSSRFIKLENLHEPNVRFTKSFDPKEHLALKEYIANETKFYNLKTNSLNAENSDLAAEIYEILQYL